jgi:hypothetical protein
MSKQKPVHEVRFGRIKAAIWENESQNGTWYSVQISRLYKNDDGEWKHVDSFGRHDLPLVAKVADQAHTWIYEAERQVRAEMAASADEKTEFAPKNEIPVS